MIRRRHVIYVQGYDPRGYVEYYRMFRGEYRKFLDLYGLRGTIDRETDAPDRHASVWTAATEGDGWQVATTYEFLRWEDIIRRDFERPAWRTVLSACRLIGGTLLNGMFFRIVRAHWRFGMFIAYPFVLLAAWLALGMAAGAGAGWTAGSLGVPFPLRELLAVAAGCAVFLVAVRKTEATTYILYLFQDVVSTAQYARRQRPDWDRRLDLFAGYVADAARAAEADEIVLIGHSSGSFLAVDVLARALALDPDLGRRGARIALLTIGGNLPIVGFQPQAGWFRERLARLATDPSIDWIDYQSRRDIMNFFPFEPVKGHRLRLAGPAVNPKVVPVQFRNIVSPERFAWLCRHFFHLHFQFLRANERPDAYDYFMIVAGPFPLALRAAMPEDVKTAVFGDRSAAREAWQRLGAHHHAQAAPDGGPRAAARM